VQKALQDKSVMLELLRWEIAEGNETTVRTAMLREMHTLPLINIYEEKFKDTGIDISAISSLIIGGIYYLNLHRERSKFSDIDLNTAEGQQRIEKALDTFGKMIFHFHEQVNYKRVIAKRLKEKGISDEIIKECLI
ncbi:TetR/AcrR family transcriptional regulator, partial [Prevotella brunnea]|nr:TetR/AcrR family transcriptional regulator [Prevotella brunnea]